MPIEIRKLNKKDLPNIEQLYQSRKIEVELDWLFRNPEDEKDYNAFVAFDNNVLVGVIGYVLSVYKERDVVVKGAIPMSWKIRDGYKGFAGVQLFKKVLSLGEFGIAIGGSEDAINLYKLFKLIPESEINEHYKLFKPLAFMYSRPKRLYSNIGHTLISMGSYFFKPPKLPSKRKLRIEPYMPTDTIKHENKYESLVFGKVISQNYINWLLDCPLHESFGLRLYEGEKELGVVVCYISENKGVKRGRIVYLPYLGNDIELWKEALNLVMLKIMEYRACYVSVLSHNKDLTKALKSLHFKNVHRKAKPLFIKDQQGVLDAVCLENWHLQYTEGDKSYRNI